MNARGKFGEHEESVSVAQQLQLHWIDFGNEMRGLNCTALFSEWPMYSQSNWIAFRSVQSHVCSSYFVPGS